MSKIVSIDSASPHISGPTTCKGCGHEGVSVAPTGTTLPMECGSCGAFKVYWRDHLLLPEGSMAWTCRCGESLMSAYVPVLTQETALMCAGCGNTIPASRLFEVPPPIVTKE